MRFQYSLGGEGGAAISRRFGAGRDAAAPADAGRLLAGDSRSTETVAGRLAEQVVGEGAFIPAQSGCGRLLRSCHWDERTGHSHSHVFAVTVFGCIALSVPEGPAGQPFRGSSAKAGHSPGPPQRGTTKRDTATPVLTGSRSSSRNLPFVKPARPCLLRSAFTVLFAVSLVRNGRLGLRTFARGGCPHEYAAVWARRLTHYNSDLTAFRTLRTHVFNVPLFEHMTRAKCWKGQVSQGTSCETRRPGGARCFPWRSRATFTLRIAT